MQPGFQFRDDDGIAVASGQTATGAANKICFAGILICYAGLPLAAAPDFGVIAIV
jgi:hypothetical protein